ncbi:MAG: glycosyltransferase family 9 protein [Candidatus Firestonebacteria bacterium]
MPNKISAVIITKNEEENILGCLKTISFADEIIVVDSESTDNTVEICKKFGCKVYEQEWLGYSKQKNLGITKSSGKWILSVDADERITDELRNEIIDATNTSEYNGFYLPRRSFFLGRWIKYSGLYPDYNLRLFKKDCGQFNEKLVHESVKVTGNIGKLKNPISHYIYKDITEYIEKFNKYTSLAAEEIKNKKFRWYHVIFNPKITFYKKYIFKKGFLDGISGLVICVISAFYTFVKYAKLWEKQEFSQKRILLIKLRNIGDMLISTPAIKAIRNKYKDSHMAFLCPKNSAEVFINNSYINEIIIYEKDKLNSLFSHIEFFRLIHNKKFDIVINFEASFRSALISLLSGAKKRIINNHNGVNYFTTVRMLGSKTPKSGIQRDLDTVLSAGIEPIDYYPEIFPCKKDCEFAENIFTKEKIFSDDFVIGISPGASREIKMWKLEKFAQLIDKLVSEKNAKILLFAGPKEEKIAAQIKELVKTKNTIILKDLSLLQYSALIGKCKAYIGLDSAGVHIAVAMGVPSVVLIGPEDSTVCHPYLEKDRHFAVSVDVNCRPCYKATCDNKKCMDLITVEQVMKAVNFLLIPL